MREASGETNQGVANSDPGRLVELPQEVQWIHWSIPKD